MNPIAIGTSQWELYHELEWLYTEEILKINEAKEFIKYVYFSIWCFMCKTCAIDAKNQLQKMINEVGPLYKIFSADGDGSVYTRTSLAKGVYELHRRVNTKLQKPFIGATFETYLVRKERKDIFETMKRQTELFIGYWPDENVKWEIDPRDGKKYNSHYAYDYDTIMFYFRYFLESIIPNIFLLIDPSMKKLEMEEIVWVDKINMFRWLNSFLKTSKFNSNIDWNLKTKILYFKAISPKLKDCGISDKQKKGTIFQGCQ
jgi:hypothetical protein